MAGKSGKKPLSLNDSHYRFLQDLSAPPKPSSKPSDGDDESSPTTLKGRRRQQGQDLFRDEEDDNIPRFSAITDFDSPIELRSAEDKKPVQVDGRPRLRTVSPKENSKDQGDNIPQSKEATDLNTHRGENKTKVKMEGRRRLCKVSYADSDNADKMAALDDSEVSDLVDFDSPPLPTKNATGVEKSQGRSEIRDILDELSSRFDILSVDKKRGAKSAHTFENCSSLVIGNENTEDKNIDYASADSSFSAQQDPCDSSSDASKSATGGIDIEHVEDDLDDSIEVLDHFDSENVNSITFNGPHFTYELPDSSFSAQQDPCDSSSDASKSATGGIDIEHVEDDLDDSIEVLDHFDSENANSITFNGPHFTYELPGKIAKMLYPHQRDGLKWLWCLHCQGKGGILGDDMGLGKTMQICSFLAGLFNSRLIKRALVVAPKTLLPHWIKELSIVGLSEKTREYFGTCTKAREYELQYILQDKGVLLTTYDIVRNNSKSLRGNYLSDDEENEDGPIWDYMILDEGHLIKNPSTQRAKSLLQIPSAHRIIISGTPLQNNLKELWALFNFCCPELLGDKQWFKENFESAILRGSDKRASEREKRVGSSVAKMLRDRIQPYFLRRLKSEVFNQDDKDTTTKLSRKREIIVWLRLTSIQRYLYEAFLKSEIVLSAFDGSPLAALTILKKICDHPLLLTKRAAEDVLEGMDSMLKPEEVNIAEKLAMHIADVADTDKFKAEHDVSCKISFIMSLLDNLIPQGHHVLIFSQTRKMLNLIQESITSKGYEFVRIDGTTKATDRIRIVNDFQDGSAAPIFLLTSQVGGLGLTLTKADRVIVVDPAWNPSTDNQSVDRAYRIGQKKDVLVYRLMTCGTVEEKIYRKQVYKGGLFKTATEHKEQIRYFSQQDLRELFSLPKDGFDVSVTQKQLEEEHACEDTVDDSFKAHIEFLKSQGIAGVSHHSLLFSKTAPVQDAPEDDKVSRNHGTRYVGTSTSTSLERPVDGAEFAFNPKEVKLSKRGSSPDSAGKLTESEIRDKIRRISQTLANKVMISRLPDKGEKLQQRLAELNSELSKLKIEERNVIDLDDISEEFQRVVNV